VASFDVITIGCFEVITKAARVHYRNQAGQRIHNLGGATHYSSVFRVCDCRRILLGQSYQHSRSDSIQSRVVTGGIVPIGCRPQKENSSLRGPLHQAIFMMAARLAPDSVRRMHQSLHHVVADAPWSDEAEARGLSRLLPCGTCDGQKLSG
jgi:hypothetical protein